MSSGPRRRTNYSAEDPRIDDPIQSSRAVSQQSDQITPVGSGAESTGNSIVQDTSGRSIISDNAPESWRHISKKLFAVESGRTDWDHDYSRIENPFRKWRPEQVEDVAIRIAHEYGLEDLRDIFIKAALVLKDPDPESWSSPSWGDHPLTDEETDHLNFAPTASFWDQPRALRTTFLMLFIAAVVQGWSQTGTNGANLSWWRDVGLGQSTGAASTSVTNVTLNDTSRLRGTAPNCAPTIDYIWPYAAVNAAPYLAASIGSHLSDPLINELLFGRRGAIMLSAILVLASSVGGAFTRTWWQLLICRIILGIGMGCKAAVVPVFAAEIAPAHLRGSLVMNWQVFDALGICLGFTANLFASQTGAAAWRWQIWSSAIPAFALLCGVAFVTWDSPRFLMKHEERFRKRYEDRQRAWRHRKKRKSGKSDEESGGFGVEPTPSAFAQLRAALSFKPSPALRYRSEAFQTLVLLRGHPILAAKELIYAHCQLLVETRSSQPPERDDMDFSLRSRSSWLGRFRGLFAKEYIRRELYAAAVVMIGQQLCGVNVLIFYSSTLFCDTGQVGGTSEEWQPLIESWGLGLMNVIFAIPVYWLIDTKGRRWLLLGTLPWLAITMAGAAAGFTIQSSLDSRKAVVTVFTYIFMAFYSCGMGPVPYTLSAEVFPLEHRMVGMSVAVSLNFLGAGLETLVVPVITRPEYMLAGFAVLNVIALVFVWMFVREVVGSLNEGRHRRMTSLNLEELFYIFEWPTSMHIRYQASVMFPHILTRAKYIVLYCFDYFQDPPEEPEAFSIWANRKNGERQRKSGRTESKIP